MFSIANATGIQKYTQKHVEIVHSLIYNVSHSIQLEKSNTTSTIFRSIRV